jgi:hypothetical protein
MHLACDSLNSTITALAWNWQNVLITLKGVRTFPLRGG